MYSAQAPKGGNDGLGLGTINHGVLSSSGIFPLSYRVASHAMIVA
jgi:hypothetical protein